MYPKCFGKSRGFNHMNNEWHKQVEMSENKYRIKQTKDALHNEPQKNRLQKILKKEVSHRNSGDDDSEGSTKYILKTPPTSTFVYSESSVFINIGVRQWSGERKPADRLFLFHQQRTQIKRILVINRCIILAQSTGSVPNQLRFY